MASRTRLIVLTGSVAFVVAAAVAFWLTMAGHRSPAAGWSAGERAAFMESCVRECRAAPGVTADRYPACDQACTCGADEGSRTMTARELDEAADASSHSRATDEQKAKLERMHEAAMRCVPPPPAQK